MVADVERVVVRREAVIETKQQERRSLVSTSRDIDGRVPGAMALLQGLALAQALRAADLLDRGSPQRAYRLLLIQDVC